MAGAHHLARDAPPQVQRVQNDIPAQRRAAGLFLRGPNSKRNSSSE